MRSLISLLLLIGLVCLATSKPFGEGREGDFESVGGTGVVGSCPSTYGGAYGGGVRARRDAGVLVGFEVTPCFDDNDCAGELICCPFDGLNQCAPPQY